MISEKVASLLEKQIGYELGASNAYLATAIFFGHESLDKWADFFYVQSEEEREHALKIIRFLVEVGAPFKIPNIEAYDPDSVESPMDAVKKALESEQRVTKQFKEMNRLAVEENDPISEEFMKWFLNEQIEEEGTMERLVKILKSGLNPYQAEPLLSHPEEEE